MKKIGFILMIVVMSLSVMMSFAGIASAKTEKTGLTGYAVIAEEPFDEVINREIERPNGHILLDITNTQHFTWYGDITGDSYLRVHAIFRWNLDNPLNSSATFKVNGEFDGYIEGIGEGTFEISGPIIAHPCGEDYVIEEGNLLIKEKSESEPSEKVIMSVSFDINAEYPVLYYEGTLKN